MCSPRPQPTPPPAMTITERNASLNQLTIKIAKADQSGDKLTAMLTRKLYDKVAAQAVDPNSVYFQPKEGPQGQQTTAPSADNLELAPEQLQGLLAKRATSTLRIPTTTPATTR